MGYYTIQLVDAYVMSKDWEGLREVLRHDTQVDIQAASDASEDRLSHEPSTAHAPHAAAAQHATRGSRARADVIFLGLGAHDTAFRRDDAWRWLSAPSCWTHGRVFQPYLDHHCPNVADSRRAAAPRAARPPVVWLTSNEQCAHKKANPAYRYQPELVTAANRAARAAAQAFGLPLFDVAGVLRIGTPASAPSNATAAAAATADEVCPASGDGVHVKQWVDLHRARLLLSYLCGADGETFTPPRPDPARFDPIAARCPGLGADGARPPLREAVRLEMEETQKGVNRTIADLRSRKKRVTLWMQIASTKSCLLCDEVRGEC